MNPRKQLIKGANNNEKFASIERTLKHITRAPFKTVVGVIPPLTFSEYCDRPGEDGIIARHMIIAAGVLSKMAMFFESIDQKQMYTFTILVEDMNGSQSTRFESKKKLIYQEFSLSVIAGTRLTVSVSPTEGLEGIWIAALENIKFEDYANSQYLLEDFEKLVGFHQEEISEEEIPK